MDNMAGKISELLASPDGMEKIKSFASALFSDSTPAAQDTAVPQQSIESDDKGSDFSLPDGIDIAKIAGLLSAFKSNKNDSRSGLLLALRPHLSEERRERVDKAVKLLRIAAVIPVLRENGLLDILNL